MQFLNETIQYTGFGKIQKFHSKLSKTTKDQHLTPIVIYLHVIVMPKSFRITCIIY